MKKNNVTDIVLGILAILMSIIHMYKASKEHSDINTTFGTIWIILAYILFRLK